MQIYWAAERDLFSKPGFAHYAMVMAEGRQKGIHGFQKTLIIDSSYWGPGNQEIHHIGVI